MSQHFTAANREELCKDSLFLFANRKPKDLLNFQRMHQSHHFKNPVAKIKATTQKGLKIVSNNSHYDEESTPSHVLLCCGAMVCVTGSNICPGLGLFNGSIGKVLDIVYAAGQSPNHNDLPLYVLVSFSLYQGKPFLSDRERVVLVVPVTVPCNNKKCPCTRTFIPLKLAFGKTCHTFQGQSAGEIDEGKPPNTVKRIICDPGIHALKVSTLPSSIQYSPEQLP